MARILHCVLTTAIAALLLLPLVPAAMAAAEPLVVVIDATRGALVRWELPAAGLPAGGFRVTRSVDGGPEETVATLKPGQSGVQLNPVWTQTAKEIVRTGGRFPDANQRGAAIFLTQAEPLIAAWLGLSFEDRTVRQGTSVSYTVARIGADGSVEGTVGTSAPIPVTPMRPPAPPRDFRAKPTRDGLAFFWTKPPREPGASDALLYEVRRADGLILGAGPLPKLLPAENAPGAVDNAAAPESAYTYTITALDVFGRRGAESAPLRVFFPDLAALDPPATIDVSLRDGKALVKWSAVDNANRRGWKVTRTLRPDTAGQTLTADPQEEPRFEDGYVPAGITVYYRVSAINRRGEEGPPRLSRALLVPPPKPVAAPAGLRAELTARRMVVLRWNPSSEPVSGYYVERSIDGKQWRLLRGGGVSETRFVDDDPPPVEGSIHYRVIAWGVNDVASAPSAPIAVTRPTAAPPPAIVASAASTIPVAAPVVAETKPLAPVAPQPAPVVAATRPVQAPATAVVEPKPAATQTASQTTSSTTAAGTPQGQPAKTPALPTGTQTVATPPPTVAAAPSTAAAAPSTAATAPPASVTAPQTATTTTPSGQPAKTPALPPQTAPATAAGTPPGQPARTPAAPAVAESKPAGGQGPGGRPATPVVSSIDGSNGKVSLRFTMPDPEANGFQILRSDAPDRAGDVIASGVLANGSGWFVDTSVAAGRTYYYRLVAIDAAGNRSAPLDPPAAIRVGAPQG